jgi:diaminopimelate epimerase
MATLNFNKMSGAGNDFIVIDNRDGIIPEERRRELIDGWCRRRVGVGADGVLLLEPAVSHHADFRMRYYNADGGEAESCGNGARCISRFAHLIGAAGTTMSFDTQAGLYQAEVIGEDIRLTMSDPHSLRRDIELDAEGVPGGRVDFINTGVPHVILFTRDLAGANVQAVGSAIRFHRAFAPAGTNVNFGEILGPDRIAVRTYERGVEGETLACGTGSVAVALIAHLKGLIGPSPIQIVTSGGPILKIHFRRTGESFSDVKLEGEARVVYKGELDFAPMMAGV